MASKDNYFYEFFFCHSHWFPIFGDLMSGQSCEPSSSKFMKSGELINANQRKTEVTSAVKNYQKSLRSQLLQEVGSRGHLGTWEAVATLSCSEFPQESPLGAIGDRLSNCFAAF